MNFSPAKAVLYDIIHAHCLTSQNTDRVIKFLGIKNIFNGKRDFWHLRKLLLRVTSEQKARDIVNLMPFPFIEGYHKNERAAQIFFSAPIQQTRDSDYWVDNVLVPISKKGQRIESITGYGIFLR